MNPPEIENLPEQIEEEVAKKKKYKDVIAGFDKKTQCLSVDVYWGKSNFAAYSYDKNLFLVSKSNIIEKNRNIEDFEDKEDQRILKILESNYCWAEKLYL